MCSGRKEPGNVVRDETRNAGRSELLRQGQDLNEAGQRMHARSNYVPGPPGTTHPHWQQVQVGLLGVCRVIVN